MASCLTPVSGGVRLKVRVQPNARRTEIVGFHGDAVKIKIKAIPEDGKANAELIEFLSRCLGVPKGAIEIISGTASRNKSLLVRGISIGEIEQRLG